MAYQQITLSSDSPYYTLTATTMGGDVINLRMAIAVDFEGSQMVTSDQVASVIREAVDAIADTTVNSFSRETPTVTSLL